MIRTGIIGTGRITHRFVSEARQAGSITIAAVFNPHPDSAGRFASQYGIDLATSDIDEFMDRIDAVYIASPHDTHVSYAEEALSRGKHVLCEKPMAFSSEDVKRLFSLAEDKGLVLIEALKTAFCPGFKELCAVISSGRIGRIVDIEASFSRLTPTNMREFQDSSFGGSFTEFGSYTLLPVLRLLGTDYKDIVFESFKLPNGTDGYCKATLIYEDGVTATCKTGLTSKTEGELVIAGTKGYIYARAPWWLTSHFEVRGEDPNAKEIHECEFLESGLRYEIKAFAEAIGSIGRSSGTGGDKAGSNAGSEALEETEKQKAETLARAGIMEAFLKERADDNSEDAHIPIVGIWGHRGASYDHPENTIPAFIAAADLPGIRGIEMDIQRTKDGEIVVFHDETLDRVMEGHSGYLRDHTLAELKGMTMKGSEDPEAFVPTLDEFLDAMKPYCEKKGLLLNIELKTSVYRYDGIERQAYDIVKAHGMLSYIVWSSFLADSIKVIKDIDPEASTGMLGRQMSDILHDGKAASCDAYHPYDGGFGDITRAEMQRISASGKKVRAWTGTEPLFVNRADKPMPAFDRRRLAEWGITDIFTNIPDRYL